MGGMVLGWGLFNLIEGVIDHQLLAIHYVRQSAKLYGLQPHFPCSRRYGIYPDRLAIT
jgi:uncharacterized membrane protein